MMLLFGVGVRVPADPADAQLRRRGSAPGELLGWWRVAIFICFAFAAVVTPTPDPFGMTLLAARMSLLYFVAVGVAFLNDKRRGPGPGVYAGIDDDEVSPLDDYAPNRSRPRRRSRPATPSTRPSRSPRRRRSTAATTTSPDRRQPGRRRLRGGSGLPRDLGARRRVQAPEPADPQ